MKNNKKIKLVITDWEDGDLKKQELCFDNIDDAKFKIKYFKFNAESDIKVKIYDEKSKVIHSEYIEKSKYSKNPKRGKGHKGEHDEGEDCNDSYA